MTPLRAILVATDFSEDAGMAARRAALLAREHGARCALLHVVPELPLDEALRLKASGAVERALGELAAALGAKVEPRVASGPAAEAIRAAAADFDLAVVGARGQHPLRDFALGTTAERLLRTSTAPVLVVKGEPAGAYRQALVPVDFSEDSAAALALAARLAPRAELSLLHAFEVPFEGTLRLAGVPQDDIDLHRRLARDAAREEMEAMIRALDAAPRATRVIEHGYAPAHIVEAEARIGADLVVIGKHGRSALEELLLGSVTLHALSAARCDVLVVPARKPAAPAPG